MKPELAPIVSEGMIAVIDDVELRVAGVTEEGVLLEGVDGAEPEVMEPNAFLAACTELKAADGMSVRDIARGSFIPGFDGLSLSEQRRAREFERHVRDVLYGNPALPGEMDCEFGAEVGSDKEVEERLVSKLEKLAGGEFGYARSTFEDYMRAYVRFGVAGLARRGGVGRPSFTDELFLDAMEEHVVSRLRRSGAKVQKAKWLREIQGLVETDERFAGAEVPSRSTQYRELDELLDRLGVAGTHRKYQQSGANKPRATYRKPPAVMPGDRVEIDVTVLNNMVTDGLGGMYRPHCGIAYDVATGTIAALIVAPSFGQPELASLILEMIAAKPAARAFSPEAHYNRLGIDAGHLAKYVGEAPEGASEAGVMVPPRVATIDRGLALDNWWFRDLAGNLGFGIEFARPYTPTDKPYVERFFRTLESVLQELPGYVGIDVRDRGRSLTFEPSELLTMAELETVLKAWVTRVYHHTPHKGLIVADLKGSVRYLTPHQAWGAKTAQHGLRVVPFDSDLLYEFMDLEFRTVGKGGIQIGNRIYNGPGLHHIRGRKCPATGTKKWPVRFDRNDLRYVYVNVKAGTNERAEWVRVPWAHMPHGLAFPLPERLVAFLRTHVAVKQYAGDDIEWEACKDVAERHATPEAVSNALGGSMSDYLEWLSGYKQRAMNRPKERTAADDMLAHLVDSARRTVRWAAKQARAANARASAAKEARAELVAVEESPEELDPPPVSTAEWDATQTPIFH